MSPLMDHLQLCYSCLIDCTCYGLVVITMRTGLIIVTIKSIVLSNTSMLDVFTNILETTFMHVLCISITSYLTITVDAIGNVWWLIRGFLNEIPMNESAFQTFSYVRC